MFVRESSTGIEVSAPAKLNLFFEVLAKRDDGFHEIETLMIPIALFDTLYFRDDPSERIELLCGWANGLPRPTEERLGELPVADDNLVVKAIHLLKQRAGVSRGASMRLIKRTPSASGMGGASSDAAAALVAANRAWDLRWPSDRLARLAAELGSDIPFFFGRTAAVCRGRGERIEPTRGLGVMHFVVVRPPEGLSTARVYSRCRPAKQPQSVRPLIEALRRGETGAIGPLLCNRLQSTAEELSPWIGRLRRQFDQLDLVGHQMSGSGTSYFGICRHARQARRAASVLNSHRVGYVVATTNLC